MSLEVLRVNVRCMDQVDGLFGDVECLVRSVMLETLQLDNLGTDDIHKVELS